MSWLKKYWSAIWSCRLAIGVSTTAIASIFAAILLVVAVVNFGTAIKQVHDQQILDRAAQAEAEKKMLTKEDFNKSNALVQQADQTLPVAQIVEPTPQPQTGKTKSPKQKPEIVILPGKPQPTPTPKIKRVPGPVRYKKQPTPKPFLQWFQRTR